VVASGSIRSSNAAKVAFAATPIPGHATPKVRDSNGVRELRITTVELSPIYGLVHPHVKIVLAPHVTRAFNLVPHVVAIVVGVSKTITAPIRLRSPVDKAAVRLFHWRVHS